jgi:hypothetical protein
MKGILTKKAMEKLGSTGPETLGAMQSYRVRPRLHIHVCKDLARRFTGSLKLDYLNNRDGVSVCAYVPAKHL